MSTKRRTTPQNAAIFRYLYGSASRLYGDEIAEALEISRSTVYTALKRLQADGLIIGHTELMHPSELGRPRRTYFDLTAKGREYGAALPPADPPGIPDRFRRAAAQAEEPASNALIDAARGRR